MKTQSFSPNTSVIDDVTSFVQQTLYAENCPGRLMPRVRIVTDELYSNIARYSGASSAIVTCGMSNGMAELIFSDDGEPYDPTAAKVPDITLSAEEREPGGLGVYLIKKLVNEFSYVRRNGWNELTIRIDSMGLAK